MSNKHENIVYVGIKCHRRYSLNNRPAFVIKCPECTKTHTIVKSENNDNTKIDWECFTINLIGEVHPKFVCSNLSCTYSAAIQINNYEEQ